MVWNVWNMWNGLNMLNVWNVWNLWNMYWRHLNHWNVNCRNNDGCRRISHTADEYCSISRFISFLLLTHSKWTLQLHLVSIRAADHTFAIQTRCAGPNTETFAVAECVGSNCSCFILLSIACEAVNWIL